MKKALLLVMLMGAIGGYAQINNGDFESGNTPPTFNTDYPVGFGVYTHEIVNAGWNNRTSHDQPGDSLMRLDGRLSNSENNLVWGQNVSVNPNTNYDFSFWIDPRTNCTAVVEVFVNSASQGVFTFTPTGGWQNQLVNFTTGPGTSINLEIRQANFGHFTDFNLDDLELSSQGLGVGESTPVNSTSKEAHIKLFPNPNNGSLRLKIDDAKEKPKVGSTLIFDSSGRLVSDLSRQATVEQVTNEIILNTTALPAGLYILHIEVNGKAHKKKFIKQ